MGNTVQNVILIILDGWGIGDKSKSDAIFTAGTPYLDELKKNYPNSYLFASGEHVGLPEGQMGNSEVGHLNIGAGRIVYQDLVRINKAIKEKTLDKNPTLIEAFNYAKENNCTFHLIGLVSDGGVHSHIDHLIRICEIATENKVKDIAIHALTDGRDTDPHSGYDYIKYLLEKLKNTNAYIATLAGRYYTMDRDKRWERIKKGYDAMVHGIGIKHTDVLQAIQESYKDNVTDEFIKPIVFVDKNNQPLALIKPHDVVFCFNFRTDRLREITIALTQKDIPEFDMKTLPLYYLTMTEYDKTYKNVKVVFPPFNVENTFGEYISKLGLTQLRIAETEKYPHVTFFFSGGREQIFEREERILIPSPKVATYDLKPEMSAYEVTEAVINQIQLKKFNFICLNYANGDMVGHTGVYQAILKAVRTVDECVMKVTKAALENNYEVLIISDHGNADYAINPDGTPNTAHSLNPVPIILVSKRFKNVEPGILADVAPTLLKMMNLNIPPEMTGKVLIK
ncbi:MAG: 2,3-bisphosphoglycerate-independent phosphoglycerate mutase [Bacteroidales bacterium]|nr:2,3-bisphosphoglycerate-independent phosphoglycerate mutase [Bacteroidales bacterium]